MQNAITAKLKQSHPRILPTAFLCIYENRHQNTINYPKNLLIMPKMRLLGACLGHDWVS